MEAKFKVSEIIAAMEKNGFPFATGTVYDETNGASCVFGQAARNLFPDVTDPNIIVANGWGLIDAVNECDGAGSDIWKYNDSYSEKDAEEVYPQILTYVKERLSGFEDTEVSVVPEFPEF